MIAITKKVFSITFFILFPMLMFIACGAENELLNEKLLFKLSVNDIYTEKDIWIAEKEIFLDDGKAQPKKRSKNKSHQPSVVIRTNFIKKDLTYFADEYHYTFANELFVYHKKKSPVVHLVSKNKTFNYTNQFFVNIKKLFISKDWVIGLMYTQDANYLLTMRAKVFKDKISLSLPIYYYDVQHSSNKIEYPVSEQSTEGTSVVSPQMPTSQASNVNDIIQQDDANDKETSNQSQQTFLLRPSKRKPRVNSAIIDSKTGNLLLAFDNQVVVSLTKNGMLNYYNVPNSPNVAQYVSLIFANKPALMYGVELITKPKSYLGVRVHTLNYIKNKILYSNDFFSKSQYFFGIEKKRNIIMIGYQKPNFNKAFFYYYPLNNFSTYRKKIFPNQKFRLAEHFNSDGTHLQGMVFTKNSIYFYHWY